MIDKSRIIIIALLAIIIIGGAVLKTDLISKWKAGNASPVSAENSYSAGDSYSVVYLTTGEVYIGKLSISPKMKLDNAYLLQVVKDAKDSSKDNFQLTPLAEALWAPKDLYVNPDQVVFYGPVKDDSRIGEALRNAKK